MLEMTLFIYHGLFSLTVFNFTACNEAEINSVHQSDFALSESTVTDAFFMCL